MAFEGDTRSLDNGSCGLDARHGSQIDSEQKRIFAKMPSAGQRVVKTAALLSSALLYYNMV